MTGAGPVPTEGTGPAHCFAMNYWNNTMLLNTHSLVNE